MASTLLDSLNQVDDSRLQLAQPSATDQLTAALQARSGQQALAGPGPQKTQQQEGLANQVSLIQPAQQQTAQAKLQSAQVGQQESALAEQGHEQQQESKSQLEEMQTTFRLRANSLLNQFQQGQKQLANSRANADLEQMGTAVRLQNSNYIQELQRQGQQLGLQSELGFKEAAYRSAFDDSMDVFKNDAMFKQLYNMNDNEFKQALAKIDINFAMDMAKSQAAALGAQTVASGIGTLAQAGVRAYDIWNKPSAGGQ